MTRRLHSFPDGMTSTPSAADTRIAAGTSALNFTPLSVLSAQTVRTPCGVSYAHLKLFMLSGMYGSMRTAAN